MRAVRPSDAPPDRLLGRYLRLGPLVVLLATAVLPARLGLYSALVLLAAINTLAAVVCCWHVPRRQFGDRFAFFFTLSAVHGITVLAAGVGLTARFVTGGGAVVHVDSISAAGVVFVAVALANVPLMILIDPVLDRFRAFIGPGQCPHCGYDLRGLCKPRCPECGQQFPSPPPPGAAPS